MKKVLVKSSRIAVLLLLVTMIHAEGEFRNSRRGGSNMGLFPFPRVGRSDPSITGPYGEMHESKRQGLIPFPRVGRSEMQPHAGMMFPPWMMVPDAADNMIEYQKRNNVNGGMWFGPRLGRLQKRSFDDNDSPWAFVALKEPILKPTNFASRNGRESEEDNDDTVVEAVLSRRVDAKGRNNQQ